METEPTYFQKDLQSSSSITVKEQIPFNYLGEISRDTPLPLLSHRTSFEESSSGKCHNNFNNSCMAGTIMVPNDTSHEHSQSSLNFKGK